MTLLANDQPTQYGDPPASASDANFSFGVDDIERIVHANLDDWTDAHSPHGGRRLTLLHDGAEVGLLSLATWRRFAFGVDQLRVDPSVITEWIARGAAIQINDIHELVATPPVAASPVAATSTESPVRSRGTGLVAWKHDATERVVRPGTTLVQTVGRQHVTGPSLPDGRLLAPGDSVRVAEGGTYSFSGPVGPDPSVHAELRPFAATVGDALFGVRFRLQAHDAMRARWRGTEDQHELVVNTLMAELDNRLLEAEAADWQRRHRSTDVIDLEHGPTRAVLPDDLRAWTVEPATTPDWDQRGGPHLIEAWLPRLPQHDRQVLSAAILGGATLDDAVGDSIPRREALISLVLAGRVHLRPRT